MITPIIASQKPHIHTNLVKDDVSKLHTKKKRSKGKKEKTAFAKQRLKFV